jgi:hypothetical protein
MGADIEMLRNRTVFLGGKGINPLPLDFLARKAA